MVDSSATAATRATELASRVTFVVITALPKEYAAMATMLEASVRYRAPGKGATHDYLLGEVPAVGDGMHAVALVLSDQSNPTAATQATSAVGAFKNLQTIIMVGIAGGVPHPEKPENHVRLGDIVISGKSGVVKYDFIKERRDHIEHQAAPSRPSAKLLQAARRLEAAALSNRYPWEKHIERTAQMGTARPHEDTDRLADTNDPSQWLTHPEDPRRRAAQPLVFQGTIGSADRLQKNSAYRDQLRDKFNVRAIEMEGAGVAEAAWQLECDYFIVRGICDYCDENKNDVWQPYAAAVAAAYARALLEEVGLDPELPARSPSPMQPERGASSEALITSTRQETVTPRVSVAPALGVFAAEPLIEKEHQAQLDAACELLKKGQARLACEMATTTKTRIWNTATPVVRARVQSLLGYAQFELGQAALAGASLIEALAEAPSDPKTQASGAFGHSLLGNNVAAKYWATKAVASDPLSLIARQVLIGYDERQDEEVLAEHEAVLGKRSELYFALGQRAGQAGDLARAAGWFKKAAEHEHSEPVVLAYAGLSLLNIVADRLDREMCNEVRNAEERVHLSSAAELLQRAWTSLTDDEVRAARSHWLVSIGVAKRLLGDRQSAISSVDEALRIGGSDRRAAYVRASIAADEKDYSRIVQLLDGLTDRNTAEASLLAAAQANLKSFDEAIRLWEELSKQDLSALEREELEHNVVHTLISAGRHDDARSTLRRLLLGGQTLPRYVLAAQAGSRLNDVALRDEGLQGAVDLATKDSPRHLLAPLGRALLQAGRAAEAAAIYEFFVQVEIDTDDARLLINALYQAKRHSSALEVCRRLKAAGNQSRMSAEAEAFIQEELGNLEAARATCEAYLATHPRDSALLLQLGAIYRRLGNSEKLSSVLDRLSSLDTLDLLEHGALHVELLTEAGRREEALEVLYELRRRHLNVPQAHLLYISRHNALRREPAIPAEVALDVAVRFTGADAPKEWLLITNLSAPDQTRGELAESHPIAKASLGKKVGDVVSFEKAPQRKWTIAELCSKYSFAHRQSLTEFGSRFPDDGRLEQYTIPESDDELLEHLRQRLSVGAARWDQVLDAYGSTIMTIGAVSQALGLNSYEATHAVIASHHGIIAANTTRGEVDAASSVNKDTPLVLDLTALVVLDAIDMLPLAARGRTLMIAQATIDEVLLEAARWRDAPEDGSVSLGIHNGELARQVFSKPDMQRRHQQLLQLAEWLRTNCRITPISGAAIGRLQIRPEILHILGRCFSDSLFLASEPGHVLVSDDLKLVHIGRKLFGIEGVSSMHLLLTMRTTGELSVEEASSGLAKLLLLNYRHVHVDATVLEAAARIDKWRPREAFRRAANELRGPSTELRSAVIVAVEFFKLVWAAALLPMQRDALIMAAIDALVWDRKAQEVLTLLRRAISIKFELHPIASSDLLRTTNVWARMHLR